MSVEILAACGPGEIRVAVVDDAGSLLDYAIERPGARDGVGDVHRGRVLARVPGLGGSFVTFDGQEGFLPDAEIAAPPTEGDSLLVRVIRAAQAGKGPRLSGKVEGEPRSGPGAVERLAALYSDAPVRVDDPALVARLRLALGERVALVRRPAFDAGLQGDIDALGEAWVEAAGGRLGVFPTPALTAIDVDAGSAVAAGGGKAALHGAFNQAMLPELARQIRLRNLSGAILVDWAGLSPRRRAALGSALAAALSADHLRPRLLGFTHLGLAEIVRTRVYPPLHEVLAGPHAAGLAGLRLLAAEAAAVPHRDWRLRASPAIAAALLTDSAARDDVARLTGRALALLADPALAPGAWRVEYGADA